MIHFPSDKDIIQEKMFITSADIEVHQEVDL